MGSLKRTLGQSPFLSIALVLSILLAVLSWYLSNNFLKERETLKFNLETEEIQNTVVLRMQNYEQVLRGGVGLFNSFGYPTRKQWHDYVETLELKKIFPGIQGIGFSQWVPPDQKNEHIQKIRNEGFPQFTIHPLGERPEYHSIVYLEPFDRRNQEAFGYDMFSEKVRREAMEKARDTGKPALSGIVTLVQEIDENKQKGFLLYLPVYQNNSNPDTTEERHRLFLGYVYAPFRINDFMEGISSNLTDPWINQIRVQIYDGQEIQSEKHLYDNWAVSHQDHFSSKPKYFRSTSQDIAGHPWTFVFSAHTEFTSSFDAFLPTFIGIGAFTVNLLLFIIFVSLSNQNQKINQKAQEITHELQNQQVQTRMIIDTALDAFFTVNRDGKIVDWNPKAVESLGWTAEEVQGKDWTKVIFSPEFKEKNSSSFEELIATGKGRFSGQTVEISALHRDGRIFPAEMMLSSLEEQGGFIFHIFLHDITIRKGLENELIAARDEALASVKSKSEFLANMSHEIRTPMNGVIGMASLLAETELTAEQKKYVTHINSAGESLLQILTDILDFSKLDAGKIDINNAEFKLNPLLDYVSSMMETQAKKKGLKTFVNREPKLPNELFGDSVRIQQILMNLTNNAVKFTESGEVCLDIEKMSEDESCIEIRFIIRDTGPGISPSNQQKLFQSFSQVDNSVTRKYGGTGLGLAISKRLVELMGGTIGLTSEEGRGSTFWFNIPFQKIVTPSI